MECDCYFCEIKRNNKIRIEPILKSVDIDTFNTIYIPTTTSTSSTSSTTSSKPSTTSTSSTSTTTSTSSTSSTSTALLCDCDEVWSCEDGYIDDIEVKVVNPLNNNDVVNIGYNKIVHTIPTSIPSTTTSTPSTSSSTTASTPSTSSTSTTTSTSSTSSSTTTSTPSTPSTLSPPIISLTYIPIPFTYIDNQTVISHITANSKFERVRSRLVLYNSGNYNVTLAYILYVQSNPVDVEISTITPNSTYTYNLTYTNKINTTNNINIYTKLAIVDGNIDYIKIPHFTNVDLNRIVWLE